MKKLTAFLLASSFTASCFAANEANIYQCINKQTLTQNPSCIANTIASHPNLQIELNAINQQAAHLDKDKVLSLMRMNPNDLSIEVVALSEEKTKLTNSKL
ncbi:hypothetical protein [Catenovulum adriaticum]|uniref:DUF4124 domain-containing protein n=1 Tax=Catenovulum adriaticum TaxID=2984846 RepID=A0ABY7AL97_9ALTE|nr:hypothetical protein [Catenovulum sp. TS8]WAJ69507.1 hypothetical protein OLW01_10025 [Catenovulum sp. TS8]